jgi:hypothetical protein
MRVSRWSRFGTADRRGAARRTPGVDRADRTHRSHPDLRERHLRSTTRTATNSDSHGGWRAVSIVHLSWRITVQRPAPAVPTHGRRARGVWRNGSVRALVGSSRMRSPSGPAGRQPARPRAAGLSTAQPRLAGRRDTAVPLTRAIGPRGCAGPGLGKGRHDSW